MRSVIILEVEQQTIRLPLEVVLIQHGIVPYLPYDHEDIVIDGTPAHRYTQPPRAPRPMTIPPQSAPALQSW